MTIKYSPVHRAGGGKTKVKRSSLKISSIDDCKLKININNVYDNWENL